MALRVCTCPHAFPICACVEGLSGYALRWRSRWLSGLAGWPAEVTEDAARALLARCGRPLTDPDHPPSDVWPEPLEDLLPGDDCGCNQGRA
jgi:hypothetical protein